jgi:hypothetical protein
MKRVDYEPEYRRRIREKAEQKKRAAERERQEVDAKSSAKDITAAIHRVEQELNGANDQEHPHKKRERRWEHAGVVGLWAAAAVGVVAVYFGNHDSKRQRDVMQSQLDSMRTAGRQTDDTIAALKTQADIMRGQLEEMRADRRPWIALTKTDIFKPLTYNQYGASISLNFMIRNTGRTPALYVFPDPITKVSAAMLSSGVDVIDEQEKYCRQSRERLPSSVELGFTMFPDQTINYEIPLSFSKNDIDKARSLMPKDIFAFTPIIIGCINYQFTFEPGKHQTWFSYRVTHLREGTELHFAIREEDGDIAVDQLSLDADALLGGGFRAD